MGQSFLEINGVSTKIQTWGRDIFVDDTSEANTKELIIIIPGNPGIPGFYSHFARALFEQTNIPVWCVGHAGHNFSTETLKKMPKFKDNKNLYKLKSQVEHKTAFLKQYVPPDTKLFLIGHSIGSYMILENLEDPEIKSKVTKVFLLFPALEEMADTQNGHFMTTFIKPIVWPALLVTWIYTMLPAFIASLCVNIYMFIANVPPELHEGNINELLKPGVLRRVFFLAFEEMEQVKQRNNKVLQNNADKIKLFYSKDDGWVPVKYYESLKRDVPGVDAQLTDINHAFVFRKSLEVARTVSNWINEDKD